MTSTPSQPTVAIAGGGLAGLAAACALSDIGFHVTLFEKRPFLGGRASSYEHPGTGEVVDNCQHVLFRLCTNLVEFYREDRRRRSNSLVRPDDIHRTGRTCFHHEVILLAGADAHCAFICAVSVSERG